MILQAHYYAVDSHQVQIIMTHLVKAGRLQEVPQHPSLVRMGHVLRQLSGDSCTAMHLDIERHQDAPGQLLEADKVTMLL